MEVEPKCCYENHTKVQLVSRDSAEDCSGGLYKIQLRASLKASFQKYYRAVLTFRLLEYF